MGAFFSALSLRVTDALLPRLAAYFTVSLSDAANVITAFAVAYGLVQVVYGPLGDRYGKFRVVCWASMAASLAHLACALAPGFAGLTAARAVAGATTAALIPLAMAWIGDQIPYERRQPILAKFLLGQILGLTTGIWFGGLTADYLSWRTPFLALALGFFLISLHLFSQSRRQARGHTTAQPETTAALQLTDIMRGFTSVLASGWCRVVLATAYLEGLLLFGVLAFVATHVHQHHGLSLAAAGSLVMLFGLGGVGYAVFSGPLVSGLGEVGLVRAGGSLMTLALLTVALAPQWQWSIPACTLCGLGFYMMHNTLQINATQMMPARRGSAMSLYAGCFFLGQASGVALASWLLAFWSTTAIISAGALGLLLLSLWFAHLRRRQPQPGAA